MTRSLIQKIRKTCNIPEDDVMLIIHIRKDKLLSVQKALEEVGISEAIQLIPRKE